MVLSVLFSEPIPSGLGSENRILPFYISINKSIVKAFMEWQEDTLKRLDDQNQSEDHFELHVSEWNDI